MNKLVVANGVSQGTEYIIEGPVVLGRSEECGIIVQDRRASRQHSKINVGPQGILIEDLGSRNGTFVNGRRLRPEVLHRLRQLDEIEIGSTRLLFLGGRFRPRSDS